MDYKTLTSEIDAREILRHLNQLGIKNISGEMLRDFIYDLKKLIKYDLYYKNSNLNTLLETKGPERLHSASTFCSRLRSKSGSIQPCQRDFHKCCYRKIGIKSAPSINMPAVEVQPRRACSCTQFDREKILKKSMAAKINPTSSTNLIKVPIPHPKRKEPSKDPVSLYHYYLSMWEKFKPSMPGENSWSEIRWTVRQNLAGVEDVNKKAKRVRILSQDDLERRRQGWVE